MDVFSQPLSIAQIVGLLSFALGLSTFYQKDDRRLKIVMLVFNFNHLIHYLLMGSMMSVLSSLLSALRTATAVCLSTGRCTIKGAERIAVTVFISAGAVFGLTLMDSVWELWPIVGTAIGTYALFMLKGIVMRLAFLVGASCWLINNILIGSIGGTLLELCVITINLVTIGRLLRDKKRLAVAGG
ncbi:TPA: YgjV family protein [Vibrio vulnificus]|nr:YgjV family protein [Vibrio vulnificus]MCG6285442.1 YgjV family protein [Vibrio vulnificus]